MIAIKPYQPRKYIMKAFPHTPEQLEIILLAVSEETGISPDQIKGKSRKTEIVHARFIYCYMAFKYTENSFGNIGKLIGGRDYSTVSCAISSMRDYIDTGFEVVVSLLQICEIKVSEVLKRKEEAA